MKKWVANQSFQLGIPKNRMPHQVQNYGYFTNIAKNEAIYESDIGNYIVVKGLELYDYPIAFTNYCTLEKEYDENDVGEINENPSQIEYVNEELGSTTLNEAVETLNTNNKSSNERILNLEHNIPSFEKVANYKNSISSADKAKDIEILNQGDKKYAYVLYHRTIGLFVVYDVTDLENISQTGYISSIYNSPNSVEGNDDDNFVYVCDNAGFIRSMDVSDPTNPQIASSIRPFVNKQLFDLAVTPNGDAIYGADAAGNGLIISTSNNGILTYQGNDPFSAGGIDVNDSGDLLIVTKYTGPSSIRIYDISTPASPSLITQFSLGSFVVPIFISGDYAYIGEYEGKNVYIVDISTPASPVVVSTITVPYNLVVEGVSSLSESEGVLYINTISGIIIVDVIDKSNPQITTYKYKINNVNGYQFVNSVLKDGYLYGLIYANKDKGFSYADNEIIVLSDINEYLNAVGLTTGMRRSRMPSGPTSKRPSSPVIGEEFFDTDLAKAIIYSGSAWINLDGTSL